MPPPVAQRVMGSHGVIATLPFLHHDVCLERVEDIAIKRLVPQAHVEASYVSAFPQTPPKASATKKIRAEKTIT